MAKQSTIAVYPLDGTNRKFVVPYEYLARRFVTVTLLGNTRTELGLGTGFRFLSANQIETTQAWGVTQGYTNIEVRRETSATQRLVDFYDGSVLRSRDLNVSAIQTIHIAEEARNMAGETLAEDNNGNLDARFRKIVNVAPATVDDDAVNFKQVTDWSASAFNQADRSLAEANKSAVSAAAALVSQNAAKASQTAAKTSETNSKASENAAKASENAAKASENAAKASENAAKASQTASAASEVGVAASASAALVSEGKAKASENAAKASENAAKASENAAKASQTAASTSEGNALASKNAALVSQNSAKLSADEIKAIELTSAASAAAALVSQNASKASQAAAKTSATNSKTSATNSRTNELKAKAWADAEHAVPVEDGKFSAKHWATEAQNNVGGEAYMRKDANLSDLVDKEEAKANLDISPLIAWPVGTCYTQYPSTPAPATLFGGVWVTLFAEEGVFFRTEGAGAQAFGTGTKQVETLGSHTHTATSNSAGAHTHTVTGTVASGGAHTHSISGTAASAGAHTHTYSMYTAQGGTLGIGGAGAGTKETSSAGAHTHSISGTAASAGAHGHTFSDGVAASDGAHSHTITVNSTGGTENRPMNRTIRVWQRTA